jgi:2-iminobutanoate/2-iminopropanoate deaminase
MKKMNVKVVLVLLLVLVSASVAFAKDPKVISTPDAPAAVGPYSQAIKYGELVFISGQLPINPATGALISTNITDATRQVMENLEAILAEAKLTFDDVLMTTVYLASINDFNNFNIEYGKSFGCDFVSNQWVCDPNGHPPARATIAAGAIPKGALLEVSMIAGK